MKKILMIIMALWCLAGCRKAEEAPEPAPVEESAEHRIIREVSGADRLYTTEYVVKKVVTYDDIIKVSGSAFSRKFYFKFPQGDRKILIPMEARIKAYIDFSGFGPDNVEILPDSTIRILLPDPQIVVTSTKVDHAGIKSFIEIGRTRFTQTEMADYEKQGLAAIIHSIPDMGITETARTHAYRFLLPLVEAMGYPAEKVIVDFGEHFTEADYADRLITYPKD